MLLDGKAVETLARRREEDHMGGARLDMLFLLLNASRDRDSQTNGRVTGSGWQIGIETRQDYVE